MNDQAIRFRIGVFVLASLLLLAVLIILFGGFPTLFRATTSYAITFKDAQGVGVGTPVRRSGVRIGQVSKIILDNETGKVRVLIQVDSGYILRRADQPTIIYGLLGGETSVAFVPPEDGKGIDTRPVEPGSELVGVSLASTGTILQKTSELVDPATDALVELKKALQKFDKMAPFLEDALKDFRDVAKVTREFIPEVRKTNDEIRELVKATHKAIPELQKTNDELQVAARAFGKVGERLDVFIQTNEDKVVKSLERLQDTLKRASDLLSEDNQKLVKDILKNVRNGSERLDSVAKNAEDMMKDGRDTMKRFNESMGKADKLLAHLEKAATPLAERSPAILKNVEESTDKLNRVLGDLRELVHGLGRGDGTIQKLLSDPALYNNLNETVAMMGKLLPRVDRILRDVEIFADKLARHPESIGLGGVVRPGSGIKEAPAPVPFRWLPGH